jgi:MFS family permease
MAPMIYLLKTRRFLPFFLTQFFGAFNDNAFKLAMLTLISYQISDSVEQSQFYQAIAGALFIAPFFLLSATAGQLADKLDKARVSVWVKLFEVVLMMIGGISLYSQNVILMMMVLTGMGVHSTFFGPIKYSILPDYLDREELLGATSLIESSTFLAILLGTIFGALSISSQISNPRYAVALTNLVAWFGLLASIFIPKGRVAQITSFRVDWHPLRATFQMIKSALQHTKVLPAVFTISWFWLIGAVLLIKLPDYTRYILLAGPNVFAFFLGLFSIGIALGSLVIAQILAGKITLRSVPWSMLLLSLFGIDLYLASPIIGRDDNLQSLVGFLTYLNNLRITLDFFFFSFSAGLFIVPLYTYIQVATDEKMRGRTIATNNIFNALFMVMGSGLVMSLLYLNISIPLVFLILALLNALVAISFWWWLHSSNAGKYS